VPALTLAVEGMHPRAIVHYGPKLVLLEFAEIGDERHRHVLDALVMERTRKMMMIDHIVARFWAEHGWNHVLAEKFSALFGGDFAPALALGFDFAHSDGKLSRAKIGNWHGRQHGFANHIALLEKQSRPQYRHDRQYKIKANRAGRHERP
jgi:hypothetical protein